VLLAAALVCLIALAPSGPAAVWPSIDRRLETAARQRVPTRLVAGIFLLILGLGGPPPGRARFHRQPLVFRAAGCPAGRALSTSPPTRVWAIAISVLIADRGDLGPYRLRVLLAVSDRLLGCPAWRSGSYLLAAGYRADSDRAGAGSLPTPIPAAQACQHEPGRRAYHRIGAAGRLANMLSTRSSPTSLVAQ